MAYITNASKEFDWNRVFIKSNNNENWDYILKISFNLCLTVNKEYGINITIEK